jgi:O-acetyl-ADP-ribose deacetylase (regulator of RNase III)
MATISNKLEVIKGDITKITVDAIVNAANTSLLGGGGVDGAIHRAGGVAILNECKKIVARQGGCKTGEAVITTAGNLPAKFVIHTVGPIWYGGEKYEEQRLEDCYRNSLQLAKDNNCGSVAFPGISTGVYRFPKKEAAKIAVNTVHKFLSRPGKIDTVKFVCFDHEYYELINQQIKNLLG